MSGSRGIPTPALILGWAGVIPFASLAAAAVTGITLPITVVTALVAYGATILAFMGGAQWGLTAASGRIDRKWLGYSASVLPALVAWPALLMPSRPALALLSAGFGMLLAYDLWTVREEVAPRWYGSLRIQLTTAVVALLALVLMVI